MILICLVSGSWESAVTDEHGLIKSRVQTAFPLGDTGEKYKRRPGMPVLSNRYQISASAYVSYITVSASGFLSVAWRSGLRNPFSGYPRISSAVGSI